jgi:hypothetical protein
LDIDTHQNYYLEKLNLLLPDIHLQWLSTKSTVALVDINPVNGKDQVLAQASTQEQMVENAAVLIRALKRAHASGFKKYQEKLEKEKEGRRKFSINSFFSAVVVRFQGNRFL